jgi:hypothetical protein
VRDVVAERLDQVEPVDRQAHDLIAVSGEPTPYALLRGVSGWNDDALLVTLQQLRAAGLIAEEPGGKEVTYELRHPLIQEVVYAELSAMAQR